MNKCFLIGAGASYGYSKKREGTILQPPLSWEFFMKGDELGIFNRRLFHDLHDTYCTYISRVKSGEIDDELQQGEPDIENLMRDISGEYYEHRPIGQLVYYIYDLLRFYTISYNPYIEKDNYQKLSNYCEGSESDVISLNYDTLFKQAAEAQGHSTSYSGFSESSEGIPVAKVHGSINWMNNIPVYDLEIEAPYEFPNRERRLPRISESAMESVEDTEGLEYEFENLVYHIVLYGLGEGETHDQDGTMIESKARVHNIREEPYNTSYDLIFSHRDYYKVGIKPPIGKLKDMVYFPRLDSVKSSAEQMIENASELVVIGSQLREDDDILHQIIGENLPADAEITLVVGESSEDCVEENIEEYVGDYEINKRGQYFGEYINDII